MKTSQIDVGGMGEIYRARDTNTNRDVAIKTLLPAVAISRQITEALDVSFSQDANAFIARM